MKNMFKGWSKLDIAWLIIANAIILSLGFYWGDNALSIVMSVTGLTANLLVAKGSILNYPFGIVNVLIYSFVSYQSALYGDTMLNLLYYAPMNIVGWIYWNKTKDEDGNIGVKSLTIKQFIDVSILTSITWLTYSLLLIELNDVAPFLDSASTVLSIVGMILMLCKYREQWYLWIIVNIVTIIMWWIAYQEGTGDLTTLLMWIVYLVNSIYGLVQWLKASNK